jgi:hypothetical protein
MTGESHPPLDEVLPRVHALVDRYRAACLWFLDPDYYPRSRNEVLRVLEDLQRYGDLEAFRAAGSIRQWLSSTSSDTSVAS